MSDIEFDKELMRRVHCLAGSLGGLSNEPLPPFSSQATAFLAALSAELLADKSVRDYPDVITFAYWCRKSNLAQHHVAARASSSLLDCRIGRGLALHIAPSNIPVNFAFSFVFALLAGNASIVRVPSKQFAQTSLITQAINTLLSDYPEIARRCAFVSYPVDDKITAAFSKVADARIIWGGDATIASVLTLPRSPRCKDVSFSDRYSVAVLDAEAVAAADDAQLTKLAQGFYNDTYLMDQNACSSAQMLFWLNADHAAKQRFWQAVLELAQQDYQLQAQVSVDKYVQLCGDIIDGIVTEKVDFDGLLTVIEMNGILPEICHLRGKGGYFYQSDITDLSQMAAVVDERFQTLSYYGLEPKELRDFVLRHNLRGIDRIVPFGSALDIDLIWDGYDLISELSRIVDAR